MPCVRILVAIVVVSGCVAATEERTVITEAGDDPVAPDPEEDVVPEADPDPEIEVLPDPDPDPMEDPDPEPAFTCDESAADAVARRPLTVEEGTTLRWTASAIAVSYEPALRSDAPAIAQAVAAWRSAPCDSPALGSPEERTLGPLQVFGRIHFVAETAPSPPGIQQTSTATDAGTGAILGVRIWVNPSEPQSSTYYARNIGRALGFANATTDASVIPWNGGAAAPTCGDLLALCEHYK
jgi:hypothetical protein